MESSPRITVKLSISNEFFHVWLYVLFKENIFTAFNFKRLKTWIVVLCSSNKVLNSIFKNTIVQQSTYRKSIYTN